MIVPEGQTLKLDLELVGFIMKYLSQSLGFAGWGQAVLSIIISIYNHRGKDVEMGADG